jgi:hypothetical protein
VIVRDISSAFSPRSLVNSLRSSAWYFAESITYDLLLGLGCLQLIVQAAPQNVESHSIRLATI